MLKLDLWLHRCPVLPAWAWKWSAHVLEFVASYQKCFRHCGQPPAQWILEEQAPDARNHHHLIKLLHYESNMTSTDQDLYMLLCPYDKIVFVGGNYFVAATDKELRGLSHCTHVYYDNNQIEFSSALAVSFIN